MAASLTEQRANILPSADDGYVKSTKKYYVPSGSSYTQLRDLRPHIENELYVLQREATKLLRERQKHQDRIIRSINEILQNIQTSVSADSKTVLEKLGGSFFPQSRVASPRDVSKTNFGPLSEADMQLVEMSKGVLQEYSEQLKTNMNYETELCTRDPYTYLTTLCDVGSYYDGAGNLVSPVFDHAKLSAGGYVPIEPGKKSRNIRVTTVPERERDFYAKDLNITRDELIKNYRWTVDDRAGGLLVPVYSVTREAFQDARGVFDWAVTTVDAAAGDVAAAARDAASSAVRAVFNWATSTAEPATVQRPRESSRRRERSVSPGRGRVFNG